MFITDTDLERLNVQLVTVDSAQTSANPYLLTPDQERAMREKIRQHQDKLRIPRRYASELEKIVEEEFVDVNFTIIFIQTPMDSGNVKTTIGCQ